MNPLLQQIEARFTEVLTRIGNGDDVPPSMALRLEGLLEAAEISGGADRRELDALLDAVHRRETGLGIEDRLGPQWRRLLPFPALPVFMDRAPVSPSTSD